MTQSAERAPVSVVIPAYNAESFLAETLESVLRQTLPPAEIIVVDDGSSDETAGVASRHGARLIRQARAGVCAARNRGILAATQPWVALLDHDDVWMPEKIARQWSAHSLCPEAGMVACDFAKVEHGGHAVIPSYLSLADVRFLELTRVEVGEDVCHIIRTAEEIHRVGWFLFPSVVLVKRNLLIEAGLFDEELNLSEDVDCFLRVFRRTSLAVVQEVLVQWRVHSRNTSRDALGIALGRLGLLERMAMAPERYPPTAVRELMLQMTPLQVEVGRMLLDENRRREGRHLLRKALSAAPSTRTAALWAASWLGQRQFQFLASALRSARWFKADRTRR